METAPEGVSGDSNRWVFWKITAAGVGTVSDGMVGSVLAGLRAVNLPAGDRDFTRRGGRSDHTGGNCGFNRRGIGDCT
jgi:hypothetical protein